LLGIALVPGCTRPRTSKTNADDRTLEQRVQGLEQYLNEEKPKDSEKERHQQFRADFGEIQRLGLLDRARQDFINRLPNALVTNWSIGFFMDTNTVWCDMQYTVPGNEESLQKEFGYTRRTAAGLGTNWILIWTDSIPTNGDLEHRN
jgi:hypothetical protein